MYEWLIGESLLAAPLYGDDYQTANSRDIYLPAGKWMDYDNGNLYEGPKRLVGFDIALDKTPLFVGGKGFIVEQENRSLQGRLYPIAKQSELTFWYADGETSSTISIDVKDWQSLSITNTTTKEQVDFEKVRYAYQFELESGQNYEIR